MSEDVQCCHYSKNYDVVLCVDDKKMFVEKKALMENFSYFEVMFGGNFRENLENEVSIQVPFGLLKFAIDLIYRKTQFQDLANFDNVLESVSYFQINQKCLKTFEIDCIKKNFINSENCDEWSRVSSNLKLKILEKAVKFYKVNKDKSPDWKAYPGSDFEAMKKNGDKRLKRVVPDKICFTGLCSNELYLYGCNTRDHMLDPLVKLSSNAVWGYSIVTWDTYNVIFVCGELKRGKNVWNTEIKMWNTLTEEFSTLNTRPAQPRRHFGCIVHKDDLFLIGGVGNYRITLSSVQKFNLVNDTWENLPDLPEVCQNPVATFHREELYVLAESMHVFQDGNWKTLLKLHARSCFSTSLNDKLHFVQNFSAKINYFLMDQHAISPLVLHACKDVLASACHSAPYIYTVIDEEISNFPYIALGELNCATVEALQGPLHIIEKDQAIQLRTSLCCSIPDWNYLVEMAL